MKSSSTGSPIFVGNPEFGSRPTPWTTHGRVHSHVYTRNLVHTHTYFRTITPVYTRVSTSLENAYAQMRPGRPCG